MTSQPGAQGHEHGDTVSGTEVWESPPSLGPGSMSQPQAGQCLRAASVPPHPTFWHASGAGLLQLGGHGRSLGRAGGPISRPGLGRMGSSGTPRSHTSPVPGPSARHISRGNVARRATH